MKVLRHSANEQSGLRSAAAAFELGVCYASGFGIEYESSLDDAECQRLSMQWILQAAEHMDYRARLALIPTYAAFGGTLPDNLPIDQWLEDLVLSHGNVLALRQLADINPLLHKEVRMKYQRAYCGNPYQAFKGVSHFLVSTRDPLTPLNAMGDTVLHFLASTGNVQKILDLQADDSFVFSEQLLNKRNLHGDTALIQAARAGHADVVKALVDFDADAGLYNFRNENALYFLVDLEREDDIDDIDEIARQLTRAGARIPVPKRFADLVNTGTGSAALRAVAEESSHVLSALLDVEVAFSMYGGTDRHARKLELLNLLHVALKLHRPNVLSVISKHLERLGLEIETLVNSRQFPGHGGFRTLLEICIFGHISPVPESGYNYPERWSRIVRFGQRYRDVLGYCIGFILKRGAFLEEEGIVKFAIESQRRDALSLLLLQGRNSLSWARYTINSRSPDMFYDILQVPLVSSQRGASVDSRPNYPLLLISMILAHDLDALFL